MMFSRVQGMTKKLLHWFEVKHVLRFGHPEVRLFLFISQIVVPLRWCREVCVSVALEKSFEFHENLAAIANLSFSVVQERKSI